MKRADPQPPDSCPGCGMTQRADCLQGYRSVSDQLCENMRIVQNIAASLHTAGLLSDPYAWDVT